MTKSELIDCVGDVWGPVYIEVNGTRLPITNMGNNKVFVCGDKDHMFGDEVLEQSRSLSEEFEVVIDI